MILTQIEKRGYLGVYRVTYEEPERVIGGAHNFMVLDSFGEMYGEYRTEAEAVDKYKYLVEAIEKDKCIT